MLPVRHPSLTARQLAWSKIVLNRSVMWDILLSWDFSYLSPRIYAILCLAPNLKGL